ncbi:MAG: proteasome alpha subunit [Verrucomicrobiales bacterium]|jgi:proteasome alpha subunit
MEPYRWLEAVRHRREYIEDQIREATPVFAASRPEGILLLGVGLGQSKVFEIFDRHGMAALGNPVDIEKLRQTAIEAAHLESFNRSPDDVALRRLISYALSTALKNSFEQIYSPPLMVDSVFAEVGQTSEDDTIFTLNYDGDFQRQRGGIAVISQNKQAGENARGWIEKNLGADDPQERAIRVLLTAWQAMVKSSEFDDALKVVAGIDEIDLDGKQVEAALLDRNGDERVKYQSLEVG